jgi:hypothetical protein
VLGRGSSQSSPPPQRRPTTAPTALNHLKARATVLPASKLHRAESTCVGGVATVEPKHSAESVLPSAAVPNALSRGQSYDGFSRVITAHTVGVERVVVDNNRRPTRFMRSSSPILGKSPPILSFLNKNTAKGDSQKPESDKEYDLKLRKFLDIAEDHSRSREEVSRGDYGSNEVKVAKLRTSASGRSFLEVHHRQQSLKSTSSRKTNGRELLRKASRQLEEGEEEDSLAPVSLQDFVIDDEGNLTIQEKKKLGIKPWNITPNDLTEMQIKEYERARVLERWQVV